MKLDDLDFDVPPEAIATEPRRPTRVAWIDGDDEPVELTIPDLLVKFRAGDLLVINDTRVIPARVTSSRGGEILFLREIDPRTWSVLFPARAINLGEALDLPGQVTARVAAKGLPQTLTLSRALDAGYFAEFGRFALPPYITKARTLRGDRHDRDHEWYQSAWAENNGSVAAPTASLHFSRADLDGLEARGVRVERVTLHVGPGTFLPVKVHDLSQHKMHAEVTEVPRSVVDAIADARRAGGRVWALGTTVARALESQAAGLLRDAGASFRGETKLFIHPPFDFRAVDVLLTNFHQPRSTLLALVAAFAGLGRIKRAYHWAIRRDFKLFSYGDLSAWIKA